MQFLSIHSLSVGWDSSVDIVTGYGIDRPETESRLGRDFPYRPDRPRGPPSLLYDGYRVFPWSKAAGGGGGVWSPTPN